MLCRRTRTVSWSSSLISLTLLWLDRNRVFKNRTRLFQHWEWHWITQNCKKVPICPAYKSKAAEIISKASLVIKEFSKTYMTKSSKKPTQTSNGSKYKKGKRRYKKHSNFQKTQMKGSCWCTTIIPSYFRRSIKSTMKNSMLELVNLLQIFLIRCVMGRLLFLRQRQRKCVKV